MIIDVNDIEVFIFWTCVYFCKYNFIQNIQYYTLHHRYGTEYYGFMYLIVTHKHRIDRPIVYYTDQRRIIISWCKVAQYLSLPQGQFRFWYNFHLYPPSYFYILHRNHIWTMIFGLSLLVSIKETRWVPISKKKITLYNS